MTFPPGPRGLDAFGFFGRGTASGTLRFLEKTARQYGPVSSFRLLGQRIFLFDDADLIREVLVTRQHDFERDLGARLLRELVGDSVITRNEPRHRERRRILQPAFHREQIASYADSMIELSMRLMDEWSGRTEIVVGAEMRKLTLSIVGASLFGADFSSSTQAIASTLLRVFMKARVIAPLLGPLRPLTVIYRKLLPNGPSLFFERERRELDRIVMPLIERRRRESFSSRAQRRPNSLYASNDIVSLLLAPGSESGMDLSDREARDEIVTFVLAGHETTATALTWAAYLLAQHPEVSARLEAEVDEVLEDRRMTIDDVPNLRYAAMVLNEAMRLYPPAPMFGRRAVTKVDFESFVAPARASVIMSPWITHRNPRYWERPESFQPERWQSPSVPKFAYFPFGGGAMMCIGDGFAKMEGTIALAEIARRYRFRLAEPADIGVNPGVTLQPSRPIRLLIERRPLLSRPERSVRFWSEITKP